MKLLDVFPESLLQQYVVKTPGDIRIGETIEIIEDPEDWGKGLSQSFSQFTLLSISEDVGSKSIGFYMNTKNVFQNAIRQFVNFQDNLYLHGGDILLLGQVATTDIEERLKFLSVPKEQLYNAVESIDQRVFQVAKAVFENGKVPIFIGGGQNNSYPILRALSETEGKAVNCINISAHTGLRPPENRHSRNPFSFALVDGYLDKYYAFGLHESEIPHSIYEFILANYQQIGFTRFEAILKNDPYLFEAIQEANEFVEDRPFGLEINLNSVSDLLLSPDYPDGFLLREIRQLIRKVCTYHQPAYIHICEARAGEKGSPEERIVGKSIALLISDFIKCYNYQLDDEAE